MRSRWMFGFLNLVTAALLLAAACASTKILQSWTAPDHSKERVKKVLVFGISPNPALRRSFEDRFAEELQKLGYQAVSGYKWAPDATNIDRDAVTARLYKENVTHVLVTRLVDAKEVQTYHAPTVSVGVGYYGPGYYGTWSSYYSVGYTAMSDPGYTTVDHVVTLETNLYDAGKEKDALVWSGESQTWTDSPQSKTNINEVISRLVYSMRSSKVI